MLFALGYLTGSIITLGMVYGVLLLYFHYKKPLELKLSQEEAKLLPKGDFIKTPTDTEILRKDKINKLSKIKNEIRLSEILDEDIL